MLGWHFFSAAVLVSVIAIPATANSPDAFRAAQDNPADAQSSDEFRAQVAAIVQSYREGDVTRGRQLIEQFRLPHAQDWFSGHLGSEQSADLANRYDRLYANFAESFEHTVEAIVATRHTELVTNLDKGEGETPTKVLRPGAKLSGIVSSKPVSLFYGIFKITVERRNWHVLGGHICPSRRRVSILGLWRLAFLGVAERHRRVCPQGGKVRHASNPDLPSRPDLSPGR